MNKDRLLATFLGIIGATQQTIVSAQAIFENDPHVNASVITQEMRDAERMRKEIVQGNYVAQSVPVMIYWGTGGNVRNMYVLKDQNVTIQDAKPATTQEIQDLLETLEWKFSKLETNHPDRKMLSRLIYDITHEHKIPLLAPITGTTGTFGVDRAFVGFDGDDVFLKPTEDAINSYILRDSSFYDNKNINLGLAVIMLSAHMSKAENGIKPGETFSYLKGIHIDRLLENDLNLLGYGVQSNGDRFLIKAGGICSTVATTRKLIRSTNYVINGSQKVFTELEFFEHSGDHGYFNNPEDPAGPADATAVFYGYNAPNTKDYIVRNDSADTYYIHAEIRIEPTTMNIPADYNALIHNTGQVVVTMSLSKKPQPQSQVNRNFLEVQRFAHLRTIKAPFLDESITSFEASDFAKFFHRHTRSLSRRNILAE